MAHINDFTIEQLREIVRKQNQMINEYKANVLELENSIKNWKQATGRWKAKALKIKDEVQENNFGIMINFKGEYEGDEIIYKIDTRHDISLDHTTIQGIFISMSKEELLDKFIQLKNLVKEESKLVVKRCFKGRDVWVLEIKENEIPKKKPYIGLQENGYILDSRNNILIRRDLIK